MPVIALFPKVILAFFQTAKDLHSDVYFGANSTTFYCVSTDVVSSDIWKESTDGIPKALCFTTLLSCCYAKVRSKLIICDDIFICHCLMFYFDLLYTWLYFFFNSTIIFTVSGLIHSEL